MKSEIRQNKITGQWVIFAPERGERPDDFEHTHDDVTDKLPQFDPDCPFCPGNEEMLPEIIVEHSSNQSTSDTQRWQVRVVPNKFPMVSPDQSRERESRGIYVRMPGYGHHEVIIEHPYHNRDLPDMSHREMENVVEMYHRRYFDLMQQDQNMMVIIFRNHGEQAGTSIRHPHSQLVSTGIVPAHVRLREDRAQDYFDTWGQSLMGDIIAHEMQSGERFVHENADFVAFVPYAAEVPFEMWIVPKRQQADFGAIQDTEKASLGAILRDCLYRLKMVNQRDADYNYIIHSSARYKSGEPHLHWYIQLRPRTLTPAGFEIGSGIFVNPSMPEDDAGMLRHT